MQTIPDDTACQVITDLTWGLRGPEDEPPDAVIRAILDCTWAEARERKLTGLIWCELFGIDQHVLDQGEDVGVAGTPYGGDYFIVHTPDAPVSEWKHVRTVADALEFYRRARA